MGTFLVTSKMNPELAARVRASIKGGRSAGSSVERRYVVLFRVVAVLGIVTTLTSLLFFRHREDERLEGMRHQLLETVRLQRAALGPGDRQTVERAAWLVTRATGPYEGDLVSPVLRDRAAFDAMLARPMLYVHGPIEALRTESDLLRAATLSFKDAFVLCLLDRPEKATENGYVSRVRLSYAGGVALQEKTPNVHRLHDAEVGLAFLEPGWTRHVEALSDSKELERLVYDFERAPLAEAKLGAKARLLLYAVDEAGVPDSPIELDGERPHDVRVGLIDMDRQAPLVRLRRRVDPSFISTKNRINFARGLDACALAVDVRTTLEAPARVP
jgi:hypothetical protein